MQRFDNNLRAYTIVAAPRDSGQALVDVAGASPQVQVITFADPTEFAHLTGIHLCNLGAAAVVVNLQYDGVTLSRLGTIAIGGTFDWSIQPPYIGSPDMGLQWGLQFTSTLAIDVEGFVTGFNIPPAEPSPP